MREKRMLNNSDKEKELLLMFILICVQLIERVTCISMCCPFYILVCYTIFHVVLTPLIYILMLILEITYEAEEFHQFDSYYMFELKIVVERLLKDQAVLL